LFAKSSSSNKANDEKQDNCTNCGNRNCPDYRIADGDRNAKTGKQITCHSGPENTDNDVTDKPESTAFHDKASKKAGNGADNEPDDNALWVHRIPPDRS
jgi:hypothetical protein